MSNGAPDWQTRTSIVAQTLEALVFKILAGEKVDINVAQQDLEALSIQAAAGVSIPITINGQTLGQVTIGPAAGSTFSVDLAAQSLGNLNIIPGSGASFEIDVIAQTIELLTVRNWPGNVTVSDGSGGSISNGNSATVLTVSGQGQVLAGYLALVSGGSYHLGCNVEYYIDGTMLTELDTQGLYDRGIVSPGSWPTFAMEIVGNTIHCGLAGGFNFESSFQVKLKNDSGGTVSSWTSHIVYALT